MSDQLLGILKIALLALLYLFFARVLWAVWSEVRGPRPGRMPANANASSSATVAAERPVATPVPDGRRAKKALASKIVVLQPKERKGATFAVTGEITVGRSPTASISIPDDTFVSQLHARLVRTGDELWVEDLGSTNGTHLNGVRIERAEVLRKGDRLQIGSTVWEAH